MKTNKYEFLRDPILLIAFVLILAGADLFLLATKLPPIVGLLPLAIGLSVALWRLKLFDKIVNWMEKGKAPSEEDSRYTGTIAEKWINRLTRNGRRLFLSHFLGAGIIIGIYIYNSNFSGSPRIGSFDVLSLTMGCYFLVYPLVRKKFTRESDFIMIFFVLIALMLLLPTLLFFDTENAGVFYESDVTHYFLTKPLSAMLTAIGIWNNPGTAIIEFEMRDGTHQFVGIAISCSGIYSFLIFMSAFLAFVLTEYKRLDRKVGVLAVIGVTLTYFANLLRMTLIIIAGYFNGVGSNIDPAPFTLLWMHRYAGEVIFICWIALFWWFAFKYFAPKRDGGGKDKDPEVSSIVEKYSHTGDEPVESEPAENFRHNRKLFK